jgi:NAD+ synthase
VREESTPPLTPWNQNKLAAQNTKARIRAVLLYHYANTNDALVLGTSNKSETLLGYGTKYGDLAADLEVIGDLYKDQVFALATHLNLPPEIIEKPPTAELYEGQTDEIELEASYAQLDPILKKLTLGENSLAELKHVTNAALVNKILTRIKTNKHKTKMPPVIKLKL